MTYPRSPRDLLSSAKVVAKDLIGAHEHNDIDVSRITARFDQLCQLDAHVINGLSGKECTIAIEAVGRDMTFEVSHDGQRQWHIAHTGDLERGFDSDDADAIARLEDSPNIGRLFALLADFAGMVRIEISNDASQIGYHWIPTTQALSKLLNSARWSSALRAIASEPRILLVDDLETDLIPLAGITIIAPGVAVPQQPSEIDGDSDYRANKSRGNAQLPSPLPFFDADHTHVFTENHEVRTLLQTSAVRLLWYWLAGNASLLADGSIHLTIIGSRHVELHIGWGDAVGLDKSATHLYLWASAHYDVQREEALQQALSLALMSVTDLATAALPAMRTARSLYELSQRAVVAEALASRRSARESAIGAAQGAASIARQAAGKSVERALIQLAAAGGVVLSNGANLVNVTTGRLFLYVIMVVTATSALVSIFVELRSGRRGLVAELADLDQYRESLSVDDIESIRRISSVGAAFRDVLRARFTVIIVYGVTLLALYVIVRYFIIKL